MIEKPGTVQSSQAQLYPYQLKALQELLANIRAVDPEARVVFLHDVVEVECREDNRDRILHMLTGGLIYDEAHHTRVKQ